MSKATFVSYDGHLGLVSITRGETRRTYAPGQHRIEQLTTRLMDDTEQWMIYRMPPPHTSSGRKPGRASWIAYPTRPGMNRFLTRQAEFSEACQRSRLAW